MQTTQITNEVITSVINPVDLSLYDNTGGYGSALCFFTKDGGVLSLGTVREELKQDPTIFNDEDDPQWFVVGSFINWEDLDLIDDHTGKPCPAVYGENEI